MKYILKRITKNYSSSSDDAGSSYRHAGAILATLGGGTALGSELARRSGPLKDNYVSGKQKKIDEYLQKTDLRDEYFKDLMSGKYTEDQINDRFEKRQQDYDKHLNWSQMSDSDKAKEYTSNLGYLRNASLLTTAAGLGLYGIGKYKQEKAKEEERLENERLEKIYESLSGQDFSKAVKGKNSKIDTDEKTLSKFNAVLTKGGKNPSKKIGKEDLRRISLLAEHPDRTSKIIRDEKRSK
jgi:hypothetical protein